MTTAKSAVEHEHRWVDDFFLSGPDEEVCLRIGRAVTRHEFRNSVEVCQSTLRQLGAQSHGAIVVQLPPSVEFIAYAIAAWRIGAQLILVDHRVTKESFDHILELFHPNVVLTSTNRTAFRAGATDVIARESSAGSRLERSDRILIQISSGSTGRPRAIGRRFAAIIAEVQKTARAENMPGSGERIVLLTAFAHAYGFFAGVLHSLHNRIELTVPVTPTANGIIQAINEHSIPTTVLGVPFHFRLLSAGHQFSAPSHLKRLVCSGEPLDPHLSDRLRDLTGISIGQLYGTTETGMIAADPDGRCRPSVGRLAPGINAKIQNGELCVRMPTNPYVGPESPSRWSSGWFHTGDSASIDRDGLVHVRGRVDSQVSIGGLKADLTEIEQMISAMDGVAEAIVVYDGAIRAYLVLADDGLTMDIVRQKLKTALDPHQRPRAYHVVPTLPKTPTGTLIAIPHWIQDDGRLLALYGQKVKHTDISKYPMLGGAMDQTLHVIALFLTALLIGT